MEISPSQWCGHRRCSLCKDYRFDLTQFLRKQIDLRTSFIIRNDYLSAFKLLENGAVDASVLTQSYPLKDAEQGFIDSENLEVTKVLLDCSQT